MSTITPTKFSPVLRSIGKTPISLRDDIVQSCDHSALRQEIADVTLPFWFDYAIDPKKSGYVLGYDAVAGKLPEARRLLVSQARLLWTFSRAHLRGYSNDSRSYLRAAEHGFRTILEHFKDKQHGGYVWSVESTHDTDSRKILYAQSFLIFALVEYARAAKSNDALAEATSIFYWIEADRVRRGLDRPMDILPRDPNSSSDIPSDLAGVAIKGYRGANTALHWMEALIELYTETHSAEVRRALEASLEDNRTIFFPADLHHAYTFKATNPTLRSDVEKQPTSYGHNVEFGWLMLHAQKTLGIHPDFAHHRAMIDHTLGFGFDHARGGVFNCGPVAATASDRGKTWWTQAEMIAALSYLIAGDHAELRHVEALKKMMNWYFTVQMDLPTGSPMWELREDGTPIDTRISCAWQAGYHDLRARWILLDLLENRLHL